MLTLLFNTLVVLFGTASAPLTLSGAGDASALIQGDSASVFVLQSASTASALVQADASAPLVLIVTGTATAPDSASAPEALVLLSASTSAALVQGDATAPLTLLAQATAFDIILGADADALLQLSLFSEVSGPGVHPAYWLHQEGRLRKINDGKRKENYEFEKPKLPALNARAYAWLKLGVSSDASVSTVANTKGALALGMRARAELGPDPAFDEEELLLLLAATY